MLSAQKLSNALTSLPATHQGLEKGLSKVKPYVFLEQTLQRNLSLRISPNSKHRLRVRDYPKSLVERITRTSEVKFSERKSALPFVTTYHPALPNFKNILMSKWHLIKNQPLLREIYKHISMSICAAFGLSTLSSILGIGACSFLLTAG